MFKVHVDTDPSKSRPPMEYWCPDLWILNLWTAVLQ